MYINMIEQLYSWESILIDMILYESICIDIYIHIDTQIEQAFELSLT